MYGYMTKHLNLVSDAPNIGPELAGDVIEIAYNLYFMFAALNIDVASLVGIDPSILTGWWAQVTMIQRDAYIQSAAIIGGKGADRGLSKYVYTSQASRNLLHRKQFQ